MWFNWVLDGKTIIVVCWVYTPWIIISTRSRRVKNFWVTWPRGKSGIQNNNLARFIYQVVDLFLLWTLLKYKERKSTQVTSFLKDISAHILINCIEQFHRLVLTLTVSILLMFYVRKREQNNSISRYSIQNLDIASKNILLILPEVLTRWSSFRFFW